MLKFILKSLIITAALVALVYESSYVTVRAYERGKTTVFWDCAKTGIALMGNVVMVCDVTTMEKPPQPHIGPKAPPLTDDDKPDTNPNVEPEEGPNADGNQRVKRPVTRL
jgi:hypothetical protein